MDFLEGVLTIGVILTAVAGAATVLGAVSVAWPGLTPDSFTRDLGAVTVPVGDSGVSLGDVLASGVVATETVAEVTVHGLEPGPLAGLVYALGRLPGVVTTGLALVWLVQVLRRGRPDDRKLFSGFTASRLRRIGQLLVIGSVTSALLWTAARAVLTNMALPDGPLFVPFSFPWFGFLSGVGALVVSEIVRRGLVLLEEVEGMV